jgi:hypothetical protein
MDTEHTETVVEKAVAYVKDMFGRPPDHRHVDSEGRPTMPPTEGEFAAEEDTGIPPDEDILKSSAGLNAESARREGGE